jgi:hypothetical protein
MNRQTGIKSHTSQWQLRVTYRGLEIMNYQDSENNECFFPLILDIWNVNLPNGTGTQTRNQKSGIKR